MTRATAYSSSCSQVVLVDLYLFCGISVLNGVAQPKIAKSTKTLHFGVSRSFKVIDVDTL